MQHITHTVKTNIIIYIYVHHSRDKSLQNVLYFAVVLRRIQTE